MARTPASNARVDPDFAAFMADKPHLAFRDIAPKPQEPLDQRDYLNAIITANVAKFLPLSDDLVETKHVVHSYDGVEIIIHEFRRKDWPETTTPQSACLYLHGGGVMACPIETVCRPSICQFVEHVGIHTFAVEYRFAPEHPYPTPLEDCYAGLQWLIANSAKFNVDPSRIGVFGESGGGCLAAGLSLLARDRKLSPPLAKQVLAYPMIDDRTSARFKPDSSRDAALAGWLHTVNLCWDGYIGADKRGKPDADVSQYAAAARATDLKNLPSTYIDLGSWDWFRDDCLEYAARLAAAEVDVEFHLYPGVPHAFEILAPEIPISRNALDNRRRAMLSF